MTINREEIDRIGQDLSLAKAQLEQLEKRAQRFGLYMADMNRRQDKNIRRLRAINIAFGFAFGLFMTAVVIYWLCYPVEAM